MAANKKINTGSVSSSVREPKSPKLTTDTLYKYLQMMGGDPVIVKPDGSQATKGKFAFGQDVGLNNEFTKLPEIHTRFDDPKIASMVAKELATGELTVGMQRNPETGEIETITKKFQPVPSRGNTQLRQYSLGNDPTGRYLAFNKPEEAYKAPPSLKELQADLRKSYKAFDLKPDATLPEVEAAVQPRLNEVKNSPELRDRLQTVLSDIQNRTVPEQVAQQAIAVEPTPRSKTQLALESDRIGGYDITHAEKIEKFIQNDENYRAVLGALNYADQDKFNLHIENLDNGDRTAIKEIIPYLNKARQNTPSFGGNVYDDHARLAFSELDQSIGKQFGFNNVLQRSLPEFVNSGDSKLRVDVGGQAKIEISRTKVNGRDAFKVDNIVAYDPQAVGNRFAMKTLKYLNENLPNPVVMGNVVNPKFRSIFEKQGYTEVNGDYLPPELAPQKQAIAQSPQQTLDTPSDAWKFPQQNERKLPNFYPQMASGENPLGTGATVQSTYDRAKSAYEGYQDFGYAPRDREFPTLREMKKLAESEGVKGDEAIKAYIKGKQNAPLIEAGVITPPELPMTARLGQEYISPKTGKVGTVESVGKKGVKLNVDGQTIPIEYETLERLKYTGNKGYGLTANTAMDLPLKFAKSFAMREGARLLAKQLGADEDQQQAVADTVTAANVLGSVYQNATKKSGAFSQEADILPMTRNSEGIYTPDRAKALFDLTNRKFEELRSQPVSTPEPIARSAKPIPTRILEPTVMESIEGGKRIRSFSNLPMSDWDWNDVGHANAKSITIENLGDLVENFEDVRPKGDFRLYLTPGGVHAFDVSSRENPTQYFGREDIKAMNVDPLYERFAIGKDINSPKKGVLPNSEGGIFSVRVSPKLERIKAGQADWVGVPLGKLKYGGATPDSRSLRELALYHDNYINQFLGRNRSQRVAAGEAIQKQIANVPKSIRQQWGLGFSSVPALRPANAGLLGGTLGAIAFKQLAKAAGLNEDQQNIAAGVGGVTGAITGGSLSLFKPTTELKAPTARQFAQTVMGIPAPSESGMFLTAEGRNKMRLNQLNQYDVKPVLSDAAVIATDLLTPHPYGIATVPAARMATDSWKNNYDAIAERGLAAMKTTATGATSAIKDFTYQTLSQLGRSVGLPFPMTEQAVGQVLDAIPNAEQVMGMAKSRFARNSESGMVMMGDQLQAARRELDAKYPDSLRYDRTAKPEPRKPVPFLTFDQAADQMSMSPSEYRAFQDRVYAEQKAVQSKPYQERQSQIAKQKFQQEQSYFDALKAWNKAGDPTIPMPRKEDFVSPIKNTFDFKQTLSEASMAARSAESRAKGFGKPQPKSAIAQATQAIKNAGEIVFDALYQPSAANPSRASSPKQGNFIAESEVQKAAAATGVSEARVKAEIASQRASGETPNLSKATEAIATRTQSKELAPRSLAEMQNQSKALSNRVLSRQQSDGMITTPSQKMIDAGLKDQKVKLSDRIGTSGLGVVMDTAQAANVLTESVSRGENAPTALTRAGVSVGAGYAATGLASFIPNPYLRTAAQLGGGIAAVIGADKAIDAVVGRNEAKEQKYAKDLSKLDLQPTNESEQWKPFANDDNALAAYGNSFAAQIQSNLDYRPAARSLANLANNQSIENARYQSERQTSLQAGMDAKAKKSIAFEKRDDGTEVGYLRNRGYNATESRVLALQNLANEHGYEVPRTGKFEAKTLDALEKLGYSQSQISAYIQGKTDAIGKPNQVTPDKVNAAKVALARSRGEQVSSSELSAALSAERKAQGLKGGEMLNQGQVDRVFQSLAGRSLSQLKQSAKVGGNKTQSALRLGAGISK